MCSGKIIERWWLKTFQFFNFDIELHSGLFYECGSPDPRWLGFGQADLSVGQDHSG